MKTIWKYALDSEVTELSLPLNAEILCVQEQRNRPFLWALIDPDAGVSTRRFRCYGTGHPIPEQDRFRKYIGTFQVENGAFVFHVFEFLYK